MATSSSTSTLGNSDETFNGTKLMRLILDGGTEALRNAFSKIHPGNLQVVLSRNQYTLSTLRPKIINQKQWDKLYPTPPIQPNIHDFDITILSVLLRNICSLSPPCLGWDNMPNVSDHSVEADIIRIKLFRNERFAHISNTAVSTAEFKASWAEISLPLIRLGIDQKEIDRLENERSALNKHLVWCDFQREIEMHYAKFTKGTRGWVFEQVLAWFNDETSKNRAFVITGHVGMGKSVISAVICKRFAEHLGASHFFQYNNSQYNNPHFLLQSLAWQVSKVIPAYKEALVEKLSGNLGKSLNNMNIEGLFSILFKEPFSGIADVRKRILIVLDAVDESESNGKDELANLISNHLHELPSYIRFVITTRPEKTLIDKFVKLNPLYIEANDERNLNDLKLVLQERISSANIPTEDLINSLAEKSDGLMLYAFLLSEIYKEESSIHSIDSLPKRIEEYYKSYFQRLERELSLMEISKDNFFSFLSAFAVANEPLPEGFVGTLFGFENSPRAKQKVRKSINTLSSLLVIRDDKSIAFFHKSIRDWLVDNSEHDYSVDVHYGHKILFDICVGKLDDLKRNGVNNECLASASVRYALKYFIPHMLNGLEFFVSDYVIDLEVSFASVCVNVDLTLNNITSLTTHEMFTHASESKRTCVSRLFFLIRKFAFLLRDYPKTFLQNVVNEGGEQLAVEASNLLETRYKDIAYLEFVKKDRKNDALEARCLLSGKIWSIDISPKHDFVVCGYKEGGIELFSLTTGKSEWKIPESNYKVSFPWVPWSDDFHHPCMLTHCVVFHPRESLILPGRLDKVLTFQGTFTSGPFQCDESSSVFSNCCFSLDSSILVTNSQYDLIVWNVLSGIKERCLGCETRLYSLSFTASGNFLATTDSKNVLKVYDVANDYNFDSIKIKSMTPVEIISTFDQNSWIYSAKSYLHIVNHDLSLSSDDGKISYCRLSDIILPCNAYSSDEIQRGFQHPEQSWFSKVKQNLNSDTFRWCREVALRYAYVGDENVLVFSCGSNIMHIFSIESLVDREVQAREMQNIFSSISTNGDFVYLLDRTINRLTVRHVDSIDRYSKPDECKMFLVVRDGVILMGGNRIPELWNSDLTQCLEMFDQLADTGRILSVSDELIACLTRACIKFFNVFTKHVVYTLSIFSHIRSVHACSIKYHVLALTKSGKISLWKDGKELDANVFDKNASLGKTHLQQNLCAEFSSEGNRLALSSIGKNIIFLFDVVSTRFLAQIQISGPSNDRQWLSFFDDKNLLCSSKNHMVYIINVERGEILTCLDVGDFPAPISVSRKRSIVCAGLNRSANFELIKVCLPRKSHTLFN